MILSDLESVLANAWSKETSSSPEEWSAENPAWGQCAVTALVVDDYVNSGMIEGCHDREIVWAEAMLPDGRKISHYFNKIDGAEHDFTRRQFPDGTVIPAGVPKRKTFDSTRDYVLSYEVTRQRYELLKQRIASR